MRTIDADILIVPGWGEMGPDHWQGRWLSRLKTARRVAPTRSRARMTEWTEALLEAIADAGRPVVLVAHGSGVAVVAHAAAKRPDGRVVGAFLVAPCSEAVLAATPGIEAAVLPLPHDPLPFPSLLVASRNDQLCPYNEAGEMALAWGSTLVDAGDAGHLDAASGHGPWPEGAMRFGWFLKQLGTASDA